MLCDICKKEMASFKQLFRDDEILVICPGCFNKEEARADYEYERQKEEGCFTDKEKIMVQKYYDNKQSGEFTGD
jgi:hypothetical protein